MTGVPAAGAGGAAPSGDPVARLTIGGRVVVRHRLPEGSAAGATDVLGVLLARDPERLVVDTARGRVTVRRSDVVAAKDVPPPASRAGRPHERVGIDDLELLMARGWVAVEQAQLGRWLLRAAGGFTGRANSVLAVGDPPLSLGEAITFAEQWYAARGLPTVFQLPGAAGFAPAEQPLGAALLGRGYAVGGDRPEWERALVMTGASVAVPPAPDDAVPVVTDGVLTPEWLRAYAEQRSVVPGATEAVLTGSDGQLFLSVRDPASSLVVGLARMSVSPGWAGVFGLWVHPDHRRRGLATALVSAIAGIARDSNLPAIYLQVSAHNAAGVRFWEQLGFAVHHEYAYLVAPPT
ncbi:MAG TPA: GNAT family N-acetyltransferase [Intrasporangium sp.]|uniref:GNAT family N-acetyltransferase n=1 Tax=Intrasporangium sp. TaxID=1925024 RepID=UPI002D7868B5|nr:GNAT family N-acetyltransferase [Intrasporangium sp.]HET7397630.1 GNAT family N-acetyltransferase [Intrasporangium sp.]